MTNLIHLIWNEQIKLYARKSTWVMFFVLAILILASGIISRLWDSEFQTTEYGTNWQAELQEENIRLTSELDNDELSKLSNPFQLEKNMYHIENDIKPLPYDGWQFLYDNSFFTTFISLFTIIIAAGIVSNEFKWGTIKLLLIRPISRSKILLSKYLTVLLFAFTLIFFLIASSLLTGALFFGLNNPAQTVVLEQGMGYVHNGLFNEIMKDYGLSLVTLVMMASFAFMISTIFRSSSMAIGLAVTLMLAGNSIVLFTAQYSWAKYILFANTNLGQYFNGEPTMEGMSLSFSVTILCLYLTLFLMASWIAFTKRDIAGY
ncbi:ABC transporter permease [Planococcus beijingensis]|uniref:ABC transporter permease n=1 Tax=Planococcus beijingensis TaxID=2782551 RepID=UPI00193B05E5|nr:ABC transporter permease [Planococcus beijingensis]